MVKALETPLKPLKPNQIKRPIIRKGVRYLRVKYTNETPTIELYDDIFMKYPKSVRLWERRNNVDWSVNPPTMNNKPSVDIYDDVALKKAINSLKNKLHKLEKEDVEHTKQIQERIKNVSPLLTDTDIESEESEDESLLVSDTDSDEGVLDTPHIPIENPTNQDRQELLTEWLDYQPSAQVIKNTDWRTIWTKYGNMGSVADTQPIFIRWSYQRNKSFVFYYLYNKQYDGIYDRIDKKGIKIDVGDRIPYSERVFRELKRKVVETNIK